MKKNLTPLQMCAAILAGFILIGLLFYAIAHEQLSFAHNTTDALSISGNTAELIAGDVVEQPFSVDGEVLDQISLLFQTYARENTDTLWVGILDGETVCYETSINTATLQDNAYFTISPNLTDVSEKELTLRIVSTDGAVGNAATIAIGNSIQAGRADIPVSGIRPAIKNGQQLSGSLCMTTTATKAIWFGQYYWYIFFVAAIALAMYLGYTLKCIRVGKSTICLSFLYAMRKYWFLIEQLVGRDFKTKYKRSVLGVMWSFLNPLLTMSVQYVVFSTLFKSNIAYYPVYLFCGIICFNYFSECINQCMISIVSYANLITKVYVPKYLYPVSKALSSSINLLFSLIPLVLLMLFSGLRLHSSFLLLPFPLVCLFMLSLGIGMALATAEVFFRDTQFLWGVIAMMWMYCTPLFYPESIIPSALMPVFKMNPLYHIIKFMRIILIEGVSPGPISYLACIVSGVSMLALGLWLFKKNQDKFILYI